MCQVAPSTTATLEFDPADTLPVIFDRRVSSLGGKSVFPCWVETDACALWVERLINSPVLRHRTMRRGQRFLQTAPTCSSAHRSSPSWLKLAIAGLKKKNLHVYFKCICRLLPEKTFLRKKHLEGGGYSRRVWFCHPLVSLKQSVEAGVPPGEEGCRYSDKAFPRALHVTRGNTVFPDQMTQAALPHVCCFLWIPPAHVQCEADAWVWRACSLICSFNGAVQAPQ